jgi:hypothetical protein
MAPPQIAVKQEPDAMSDFVFLGLGLAGFALMLIYARICARL